MCNATKLCAPACMRTVGIFASTVCVFVLYKVFLDAIASPSSYPFQSVGGSVSEPVSQDLMFCG